MNREELRIGLAYNQKPDADDGQGQASGIEDRYAEWDDPETIAAVTDALSGSGTVIPMEADRTFPERLREAAPDIVFNIAEGIHGPSREAHVPAICEFMGFPYTGSDPLTLALGLDKQRTKEILKSRGVPTPPWTVAGREEGQLRLGPLSFPLIVKPLYEGSSKGIDIRALCGTQEEAKIRVAWVEDNYGQPSLVEEFLCGREFTVAVLGNGATARALPVVEILFDSLPSGAPPLYGWEAKWVWDTPEAPLSIFQCPAPLDERMEMEVASAALAAFHALGCRDWARIDVRLDSRGRAHVLEVNALPGILPDPEQNSCFPKAARAAGMDYPTMIQTVLATAMQRLGLTSRFSMADSGRRAGTPQPVMAFSNPEPVLSSLSGPRQTGRGSTLP